MAEDPRILIIIPAHNEADSLARVIGEIRAAVTADIVVVDDGSTDNTAAIALQENVELLSVPFNLGIGSTMQTGFKFAHRDGYDIAVQVDGDGQHDPSELPLILKPVINGECDLAMGSRYLERGSYSGSAGRRAGTAIFSRILSLMTREKLTDATSGFRAINRRLIELFAHDYPRDYPEVEVLLIIHLARFRIREVPVAMRRRGGGRSSINSFRSVYYMVKVLLALLVAASRRHAPELNEES
ncbi:MAG: glycosyltransferase family 2 protein [Thermoleophilia bacterium]